MKLNEWITLSGLLILSACASAPKQELNLASATKDEMSVTDEKTDLKTAIPDNRRFLLIKDVKEFDI